MASHRFQRDFDIHRCRRAAVCAIAGAVAYAGAAVAQTGYFQGVTPRPADVFSFPASLTVTRSSPAGGEPTVVPTLYTHTTTHADSRSLEWANLTILKNNASGGENVALYGQARKAGTGATWAGVLEMQDEVGTGPMWGLEIDAFSTGPSRFAERGGGDRIALGMVFGRAYNQGPKATIDYGIWMLPSGLQDAEADVNYGIMVSTQCRYACFAMRGGEKFAWEESAKVVSKFDPATGRWGLYNDGQPLFEIDTKTGDMLLKGKKVKVVYDAK